MLQPGGASLAAVLLAGALGHAVAADFEDADVYARVEDARVVLGNSVVERSWRREGFATGTLADKRSGGRSWTNPGRDFALVVDGVEVSSDLFSVTRVEVETLGRGGLRVRMTLAPVDVPIPEPLLVPPSLRIIRTVEAYPGVAGFRSETIVEALAQVPVSGYVLDELRVGNEAAAEIHSFRAGADWRDDEDSWSGPPAAIGDVQPGSWRVATKGEPGEAVAGTAQWMTLETSDGRQAFLVLERNDYASSQMSFDGERGQARVDLSRDVVYTGPFEESIHVGNPTVLPTRHRVVLPGRPLRLEPVFTGFGTTRDDAPWQHFRYLEGHRMPPYPRAVTFNSNGVDSNRISTGAKDDMDLEAVIEQAAVAKEIGVETFILDDGWQARSGDWCPDSPSCPEPRWDGTGESKFRPRFPDSSFRAVRDVLGPEMELGLWWTPMHFNPTSDAWREHPEWACHPVSLALVAVNLAQPDSSSNEAGIGTWNPDAIGTHGVRLIDYIEGKLRKAITEWGARFFKFDFLVWLDCLGVEPVDAYRYRESFLEMLDSLIRDYPEVTFQIDETNDYRLFPFESVARGPSWFQNGSPIPRKALHASWILSPFVPAFSLGRNALGTNRWNDFPIDYLMAAAIPSYFTFFSDLTRIPAELRPDIRRWTDYYKTHREDLATFTYPLLPEPGEDDPIGGSGWVALQPWNPEKGRGALLVYRQDSPESSRTVRLRNVPDGSYCLYEAPDEPVCVLRSAQDLRDGIEITLPTRETAKVFRIERTAP